MSGMKCLLHGPEREERRCSAEPVAYIGALHQVSKLSVVESAQGRLVQAVSQMERMCLAKRSLVGERIRAEQKLDRHVRVLSKRGGWRLQLQSSCVLSML